VIIFHILLHGECLMRLSTAKRQHLIASTYISTAQRHIMTPFAFLPLPIILFFYVFRRHPNHIPLCLPTGNCMNDVLPDLVQALTLNLKFPDPPVLIPDPGLCLFQPALSIYDLFLQLGIPLLQPLYVVGLVIQLLLQLIDHMLILRGLLSVGAL